MCPYQLPGAMENSWKTIVKGWIMMKKICNFLTITLMLSINGCSLSIPSSTPPTALAVSSHIVFYHLAVPSDELLPENSVTILLNELILSPVESTQTPGTNTASNIRTALEAMIVDTRNYDVVGDLVISNISFNDGHADVSLHGDVHAAGDVVLIAVRMMVLLTVFSEETVETAFVTLNDKNIANLGLSFSGSANPEDYRYTRAEINDFVAENIIPSPG